MLEPKIIEFTAAHGDNFSVCLKNHTGLWPESTNECNETRNKWCIYLTLAAKHHCYEKLIKDPVEIDNDVSMDMEAYSVTYSRISNHISYFHCDGVRLVSNVLTLGWDYSHAGHQRFEACSVNDYLNGATIFDHDINQLIKYGEQAQ